MKFTKTFPEAAEKRFLHLLDAADPDANTVNQSEIRTPSNANVRTPDASRFPEAVDAPFTDDAQALGIEHATHHKVVEDFGRRVVPRNGSLSARLETQNGQRKIA